MKAKFIVLSLIISSFCCFGQSISTDDERFNINGLITIHYEEADSLTYLKDYFNIALVDSGGNAIKKQWELPASVPFTIPDLPAGQYLLRIYPYPEYGFGAV